MIQFLLTAWWLYLPIIFVLLFLTHRNRQQIEQIKRKQAKNAEAQMKTQNPHSSTIKKNSARIKKAAGKISLGQIKK